MASKLSERDSQTMGKIKVVAEQILAEIEANENPHISIPVHGSSNVIFDEKQKKLLLGGKIAKRYLFNVGHARKFMQTLLAASYIYKDLLSSSLHATIRDLYYAKLRTIPGTKENTFDEQEESNAAIVDLELAISSIREHLNLAANPRGRVVGKVKVKDIGDTIDWAKMGSGGWAIPSIVEDIEFKDVDAEYVLVAEKVAIFMRLHEDRFWEKNNCILMTTEGQAPRGTRRMIQRLAQELKLPVLALTDSDPYGWYIYSAMKYGSMALAHTSDRLGTPEVKFLGMSLSDIEHYDLRKVTIKAKDVDIKRAEEMKKYAWFQTKEWQRELDLFLDKKIKAELQSLSSKGLQYISNTYIPEKIKNKDYLP